MMRHITLLLCAVLAWAQCHPAAARLWGGLVGGTAPFTPVVGDEFIGPIAGWYNVKLLSSQTVGGMTGCPSNTSQAAVGNGSADDTVAIQHCLSDVASGSNSPVLWFPASSTYKITSLLTFANRAYASIVGENPATTTLKWAGSAGGTMLYVNGVAYSRIDRLTFDGSSTAAILVDESWDGATGNFDDGLQYADDTFKDAGYGIRGGANGFGFADISILRGQFLRNTTACVYVGNFNALGVWPRFTLFDHCNYGVTANTTVGGSNAGNFNVYNSVFRSSTVADMQGGSDPISARENFSSNSARFIGPSIGGLGSPLNTTLQANTILDPTNDTAISQGAEGPTTLYDNVVRSGVSAAAPIVHVASPDTADGIGIGNTFTVASPISIGGRLKEISTNVVSRASITTTEPALPGAEPNLGRTIFEVTAGSSAATIQTAINSAEAVANRAVVHLKAGNYTPTATLTLHANSDVQIVGDGFNTAVTCGGAGPVFNVIGPTKATFRELRVDGSSSCEGIVGTNLDQTGSHIFMEGVQCRSGSQTCIWADAMDSAVTEIEDLGHAFQSVQGSIGIKVTGGPSAAAGTPLGGKVNIYSGAASGEAIPYAVSNGGTLLARDVWYESSRSSAYLRVIGRATVTMEGQRLGSFGFSKTTPAVDLYNLNGVVNLANLYIGGNTQISGTGTNASVLGAGLVSDFVPASAYFVDNASATSGLLESRQWTTTTPGAQTIQTANSGTNTDGFVTAAFAQTRGEKQSQLSTSAAGITDLRFYRVWGVNGTNTFHLMGGATGSPFVTESSTPGSVTTSESSTISWNAVGATSCAGSGFSTGGATSGTASVSPTSTTRYTVTCTGATGLTDTAIATVQFVSPGTEFVVNGNFESGTSSWAMGGATVVAADAHSPTHSAAITPTTGPEQLITGLTPNTTYVVRCWAHVTAAGTLGDSSWCGAKAFDAANTQVAVELTPAASYAQFSQPFTTDSFGYSAKIFGFSDTATVSVDDISVQLQ